MTEDTPSSLTRTSDSPNVPPPLPSAPPPLLKHTQDLNYMHRPPRIVPNYGKKTRSTLPKTSISRVLLYDNVTQAQMLHVKMTHLRAEQRKTGRLMDLHRKSFIVRRQQKQKHVTDTLLHVDHSASLLTRPHNANRKARKDARVTKRHNGDENPQNALVPNNNNMRELGSIREDSGGDGSGRDGSGGEGSGEEGSMKEGSIKEGSRNEGSAKENSLREGSLKASRERGDVPVYEHDPTSTSDTLFLPPVLNTENHTRATHTTSPRQRDKSSHRPLPQIHRSAGVSPRGGGLVFHMHQDHQGLTRLMHTFHKPKGQEKARKGDTNVEALSGRTTEDERYMKLERLLVRIEPRNEGYLELSPSFHIPRQVMTFTRPSSFQSLYRRRSSSMSPSPVAVRPSRVLGLTNSIKTSF